MGAYQENEAWLIYPQNPDQTSRIGRLGWRVVPSSKEIASNNGEKFPEGSLVADLHFNIPEKNYPDWQLLSATKRARIAVDILLSDLISIAEHYDQEDSIVDKIVAFSGTSHLVKRPFLEDLGFTVVKPEPEKKRDVLKATEQELWKVYGFEQGEEMRTERVLEFWATKKQMIAALPLLREKRDRLRSKLGVSV